MRLEDKSYAIKLRKEGDSYSEIIAKIPNLSKSTLSGWLKYIELTPKQLEILEKKSAVGRARARWKASITHRDRRIQRTKQTINQAEGQVPELLNNPLFLLGTTLYWCEGTHKSNDFSFINSDVFIIKAMIKWLDEICGIHKKELKLRLYIHEIYAKEKPEEFWSNELNIPISRFKITYKPTTHKIKKNSDYKGCLRIRCGGVELFRKFLGWRNGVIKSLEI